MKKHNTLCFFTVVFGIALLLASCYTPSPLYGTWVDGPGKSQIVFTSDGNFSATIVSDTGATFTYSGTYTVLNNNLHIKKSTGSSFNTEWDIRGSMLYLTWTYDNGKATSLTLFQISK